jgi:hypothetical protein
MAKARTLKDLLAQADAFVKVSQASTSNEVLTSQGDVEALANKLASASAEIHVVNDNELDADFEKLAESFNRYQTVLELNELFKVAEFENKARQEGFNDAQIAEAINKIAAEKLAKNLPFLAALKRSCQD